jgi:hypothetical protein
MVLNKKVKENGEIAKRWVWLHKTKSSTATTAVHCLSGERHLRDEIVFAVIVLHIKS